MRLTQSIMKPIRKLYPFPDNGYILNHIFIKLNQLLKKSNIIILLTLFIISFSSKAEPWVDTSNAFLRSSIVYLSDRGYITTPITTFPLMWHDIKTDLNRIDVRKLTKTEQESYYVIKHALKRSENNQTIISANLSNKDKRYNSFGETHRDRNDIRLSTSLISNRFAANLSTTYNNSPIDDEKIDYSGSYLATYVGNWVLSVGAQDRWWGSAWDTSLSLTNNAKPLPAVSVTRKSAIPFKLPYTEIKLPWTVTSFIGIFDDERVVKNALLWGFRLNVKLTKNLEFGVSRLAQFGGDGRPNNLSNFGRLLLGEDNCGAGNLTREDCINGEEPGNQQAGYDLRWSTHLLDHPFNIYVSVFAEDGDSSGGLSFLTEEQYQVGFDTNFHLFNEYWRLFIETTDTFANCNDRQDSVDLSIGNCFYEHSIYRTGIRYKGQVLGNIYESDTRSVVAGLLTQSNSSTNYEFKFRWLQLNQDNSDIAPNNELIGNTLTTIAEDVLEISTRIEKSHQNWRFTFGGQVSHNSFDNEDVNSENNYTLSLDIEYNL